MPLSEGPQRTMPQFLCNVTVVSVQKHFVITVAGSLTFLHILGLLYALLDLLFVFQVCLTCEGLLQPRSEVIVAQGILSSKKEKL